MTRTARLFLRLTPEEKQRFAQRAKACDGYTLASFAREMLVNGKVQPVLSIHFQQWAALGGLMNNVNQLARHANTGTAVTGELQPLLEQTYALLEKIRADMVTKEAERA